MPLPLPTLSRTWRLARVGTAALALTAAALTVSGAAAGSPTAGPAPATTAAAAECLGAAPDHRVRVGSGLDGVDPNTLTPAQNRLAQRRLESKAQQRRAGAEARLGRTRIDVYVHVIAKNNGKGGVSTKRVKQQIAVLNKAYAGKTSSASASTPFYFKLKKITRTKNSSWYAWDTPTPYSDGDDVAPKEKLHRGNWGDLNLYVARPSEGVLGYSSFPWSTTLERDGVVVLSTSLPGGTATGYNKGDTATHEVGHWLGLLHTFDGGCSPFGGDHVDDTPAQADGQNIFSCDATLDTCAAPGTDPVRNFMSYGDDGCLNRFSAGQAERMGQTWLAYRAPGAQA